MGKEVSQSERSKLDQFYSRTVADYRTLRAELQNGQPGDVEQRHYWNRGCRPVDHPRFGPHRLGGHAPATSRNTLSEIEETDGEPKWISIVGFPSHSPR